MVGRYLAFPVAYLLGAIPWAFFAGKLLRGIDIREHGSGNMGTTNTFRVLGKEAGIAVLVGDVLKGAVAAWIGLWAFSEWGGIIAGLLAIAGHSWNPFFGFKPSGKGVASGFGIILVLMTKITLLAVSAFLFVLLLTRIVSLSSAAGALTVLATVLVFPEPLPYRVFGIVAALLVLVRHRTNFQRVRQGTEPRIGKKKGS